MDHKCKFCEKSYESGQKLGCHIRTHNRKLKRCPVCEKSYDERKFQQHVVDCFAKSTIKYNCKFCKTETSNTSFCSISCSNKSRKMSQETKEKIRNSIHSQLPMRCSICKHCEKLLEFEIKQRRRNVCHPLCDAGKKFRSDCLSKSLKGKTGGIRKGGGRGKGDYYKDIWMDSTWEIEMAKRLDFLSLNWERDTGKHRFSYVDMKGNERFYYPDFYLPELCLYLEVKGYWTSETKHKMNDVIKRHEHTKFTILESLKEIQNFAGAPE